MQPRIPTHNLSNLLSRIPLYPFLLSMSPILYLYQHNYTQIDPASLWRPIGVSVIAGSLVFLILYVTLRNVAISAAITSLSIFLFLTYGQIYEFLKPVTVLNFQIGRHRFLIPALMGFSFLVIRWISKHRGRSDFMQVMTGFLNIFGFFLVLIPTVTALTMALEPRQPLSMEGVDYQISNMDQAPDIYYIIVDAYSREDLLLSRYHYDNSAYIQFLEDHGFFVAHESHSNYLRTLSSLSSALNLDYLHNLASGSAQGYAVDPRQFLDNNRVRRFLENSGYTIVALASGWPDTEWEDADYFLTPNMNRLDEIMQGGYFTTFENLLIETTAFKILLDFETLRGTSAAVFIQDRMEVSALLHQEVVLAEFDNIELSTSIPGPKFIFAHIISPHPPYLFGPNGEFIPQEEAMNFSATSGRPAEEVKQRYIDQLIFITKKLQQIITYIIENNDRPTVIIVQSDHGRGQVVRDESAPDVLIDRASILYSIYFDEECLQYMYPSISPVNTCRSIFNCYFDGNMPLQDDTTYDEDRITPLREAYPEFFE